jgi:hypothetical protein
MVIESLFNAVNLSVHIVEIWKIFTVVIVSEAATVYQAIDEFLVRVNRTEAGKPE